VNGVDLAHSSELSAEFDTPLLNFKVKLAAFREG
jgi:hypothetical protein